MAYVEVPSWEKMLYQIFGFIRWALISWFLFWAVWFTLSVTDSPLMRWMAG